VPPKTCRFTIGEVTVRIPEAFRTAAEAARAAQWRIEHTAGNHLRWLPPSGPFVITAGTPSDPRGIRNDESLLRRAGLQFGRRQQRKP
jgi:hypothetical protein